MRAGREGGRHGRTWKRSEAPGRCQRALQALSLHPPIHPCACASCPATSARSIILYILVGVGAIACGVIYYQTIDSIVNVANGSTSSSGGSLCSS